jgi:hypothetical protein
MTERDLIKAKGNARFQRSLKSIRGLVLKGRGLKPRRRRAIKHGALAPEGQGAESHLQALIE